MQGAPPTRADTPAPPPEHLLLRCAMRRAYVDGRYWDGRTFSALPPPAGGPSDGPPPLLSFLGSGAFALLVRGDPAAGGAPPPADGRRADRHRRAKGEALRRRCLGVASPEPREAGGGGGG
jgi:hypothetical protein